MHTIGQWMEEQRYHRKNWTRLDQLRSLNRVFFSSTTGRPGAWIFLVLSSFSLADAMKLFRTVHEYAYEWSLVSAANWQKYPNEHCPHVQHVDVLNRTVDPETGVLTTERLITVNQNVPALILKVNYREDLICKKKRYTDIFVVSALQLLGGDTTQYVREVSVIDPKKKTLTMTSQNLTMSNFLSVEERIVYSEHPEDKNK